MLKLLRSDMGKFVFKSETSIDSFVFRLHYKYSVLFIVMSVLFVTGKQIFSEPMMCTCDGMDKIMFTQFCMTHSTSTILELLEKDIIDELIDPGIGLYDPSVHTEIIHKLYIFSPLLLGLLAILLVIPHKIWVCIEGGRIKTICKKTAIDLTKEGNQENEKVKQLTTYFER